MNKFNYNFDENNIPLGVGDRYYAQDMARDNRYLQNLPLRILESTLNKESAIIRGLQISKTSNNILSLTGGAGYCKLSVKTVDDSVEWAVPPATTNIDIMALINVEAQAIQLTEDMLNGNTQFVKIKYKEEPINTRVRQNLGGSYSYVVADSYSIIIDENEPTRYDLAIGTIKGDGTYLNVTSISTEHKTFLTDLLHPIGSLYWSNESTDPSILFGGVWSQIKDKFILGTGDTHANGSTGGSETVTLTIDEIPSHNHDMDANGNHTHGISDPMRNGAGIDLSGTVEQLYGSNTGGTGTPNVFQSQKINTNDFSGTQTRGRFNIDLNVNHNHEMSENGSHVHEIQNNGGGGAHENMPPYITKYCWERIA